MPAKNGDTVKILYVTKLDDGTIVDSSQQIGGELIFTIGKGEIIKGFEENVLNMEAGEEKKFRLTAENAYGPYLQENLEKVPKSQFPIDNLQVGMTINITTLNGMKVPARIIAIENEYATIDLNHPLAGKDLNFRIRIKEIIPGNHEQIPN